MNMSPAKRTLRLHQPLQREQDLIRFASVPLPTNASTHGTLRSTAMRYRTTSRLTPGTPRHHIASILQEALNIASTVLDEDDDEWLIENSTREEDL